MSTDIVKYILIKKYPYTLFTFVTFFKFSIVFDVERVPENTKPTIPERLELQILLDLRNMVEDWLGTFLWENLQVLKNQNAIPGLWGAVYIHYTDND